MFLGQHGVITGGTTVGRAFHDLYYLERACMNQVMALSTQQPLREVPDEMALKAEQQYDSQRDEAELHFESLKRVCPFRGHPASDSDLIRPPVPI